MYKELVPNEPKKRMSTNLKGLKSYMFHSGIKLEIKIFFKKSSTCLENKQTHLNNPLVKEIQAQLVSKL